MTLTQRAWISAHAYDRLCAELSTLQSLERDPLIGAADLDQNVAAIKHARRVRIQQIHELLVNAVVGEDPPNDGVAEPGMVLTIRYDDTGDIETFLLGVRGAELDDLEIYSVESPMGAAILGCRAGEHLSFTAPSGATVRATLLDAVPHGLHNGSSCRSGRMDVTRSPD